jgi:DNA-binding CsgD family transcriptional regulator/tetratricopeptide (TPR) repeat protein
MTVDPTTATLVGRVEELAVLDRLLGSARAGRAAVVLVAGEAGMGKSRLVGELRARAEAAGALVATGRTPLEGAALPYGTVVGLVRDLAHKLGPHQTANWLEPVQHLLLGSAPEQVEHGQVARIQLFDAMLRAVEGLAAEQTVVLVLEDLHWADTGSLELLDYLVRNVDDHAVLVAGTYRSDEVGSRPSVRRLLTELRRHAAVTTLELAGLSRDEVATLLAQLLGEMPSWTVVDAVRGRSEGNPLFAEELVRARDAGGLPPALRDLLASRIEELPDDARVVVAAAAVLGVSCDHRLLALVADLDPKAFDAALAGAVGHGVLVADGVAGTVRFRHALLREAAHLSLLPAERVRLHHRAAEALGDDSTLVASGPGHVAAGLAEHRFEAGEWSAACAASIEAARASTRLYSMHAARAHLQRAVDAHRLAAGACVHTEVDDSELYRMAADACSVVGDLDAALTFAKAALDALDPSMPLHRAVSCSLLLARCAWNVGQHETAFAAVNAAQARLGDLRTGPDVAEVLTAHARLLMGAGRMAESVHRCEEALVLARAANARLTEGHILATLGPCLADRGDTDRAVDTMRDAVVTAEEVGDPDLLMRAYNNLTFVLYIGGRLDEMVAVAIDAMNDTSPLGIVRLGGAGHNAVDALVMLGRWDEAAHLNALMAGKAAATCTSDTLNTALLAMRRGELDAADAELEQRAPTAPQSIALRDFLLAEIALERGRPQDAAPAVDHALGVLAGADLLIEVLTAHTLGLRTLADQAAQPLRPGRRAKIDPAKMAQVADSMLAEAELCIDRANTGTAHNSPWADALIAQCRAEATRVRASDPASWAAAAASWDRLPAPFHAASCRFREAEALLSGRRDRRSATTALLDAWETAQHLGATTLAARCERLAERARLELDNPSHATPRQRAATDLGLTSREAEVLDLLTRERTDAQIAQELFISKKTASVHVSNILRKLDASDRRHAAEIGRASGLGEPT